MVRGLIFLTIALAALQLYAFVDCAMRDDSLIKRLPKWGWLLIIFFIPLGAIAYFVAGRKPKGGKIIQQLVTNETQKEEKENIILHLKCSMKDKRSNSTYLIEWF